MTSRREAVRRMLEPRSVAVVGASARPGSFGERMAAEVLKSPASPTVHLVHPSHDQVLGRPCHPWLGDVPEPVDLVLLGVPDKALPGLLSMAAERGDGGAVVFGTAQGLAPDLAAAAGSMPVCGPGCMGFVNVTRGIRAIGYVERPDLTPGPLALVTHSGSLFSALLRTHRRLEYSVAVSSGRELLATTADYLGYALDLPETRVVGLFLETIRDAPALRSQLARAAAQDVPVVALTVGTSRAGRTMVGAHSGALAGDRAAWEALFDAYGVHEVRDVDELVDTLELFAIGRRARPVQTLDRRAGLASVHDSGGERALAADLAEVEHVPFAELAEETTTRLSALLDEDLIAANPLDVWGRGNTDTEELFGTCLAAMAGDDAVQLAALAVDLVEEYDGDDSFPLAAIDVHARTGKPVVVLSSLAAGVDQRWATRLRAAGIPVLEGLTSGLRAIGHLLDAVTPARPPEPVPADAARRDGWLGRLGAGLSDADAFDLLADYGLAVARPHPAGSVDEAVRRAGEIGYPVVLKAAGVAHKTDVGGVVLAITEEAGLRAAYHDLTDRLGPDVLVQQTAEPGVELALGVVRDPLLGPLVLVAVGGTLTETIARRAVALPPLTEERASRLLDAVPSAAGLLAGVRGSPPADWAAVVDAVVGLGRLAAELGEGLDAVDVNPLVCTPDGAVAVDVLVVSRSTPETEARSGPEPADSDRARRNDPARDP
ncbi:MAG: acetate--CoA ligase family protein [Nocardioidaceae bacterium]